MSGSTPPVVELLGASMASLVQAIPETAARTRRPVIVIGGLAVMCRLSEPYRATSDVDTVNRRAAHEPRQLEVLLASGAESSGASGVLIPTATGLVQVDVLEISDADLEYLPDDPTDRLHVLSHAWAAESATPMILRTDGFDALTVRVSEPGPLIAMKLQSIMNRGQHKEGTDLLDVIRLSLDTVTGPASRDSLSQAGTQLRDDALMHARRWFIEQADRTLRLVRAIPEGRDTDPDDVALVGDLLQGTLIGTES